MRFYSDKQHDQIIETEKYSICEEFFGVSIKNKSDKWKSNNVFEIDKVDFQKFIKYEEFSDIIDNYNDDDVDRAISKFFRLRAFL